MIQYFGKEKSEIYRRKLLVNVSKNAPKDSKEIDAITCDFILPCLQNSSLIPLFYPSIEKLDIENLEETIKNNPDEYQMFSKTLLMKNYAPLKEAYSGFIKLLDQQKKGTPEWEMVIKFVIR